MLLLIALGLVSVASASAAVPSAPLTRGQELYARNCFACHQLDGAGVPGVFPPLAKSDYLAADVERAIRGVVEGLTGNLVVNGQTYAGVMPPIVLDDADVADVFTYVLNNWGNPGGEVTAEVVARVRSRSRMPTGRHRVSRRRFPGRRPRQLRDSALRQHGKTAARRRLRCRAGAADA